jgi:hypothetical protein
MNGTSLTLGLDDLKNGQLGISVARGSFLAKAGSHCLRCNDHLNPVLLYVILRQGLADNDVSLFLLLKTEPCTHRLLCMVVSAVTVPDRSRYEHQRIDCIWSISLRW